MDNQLPELKVNMLGRFSITYGEQPITFKRNSATKAVKLLQILLHSSIYNRIHRIDLKNPVINHKTPHTI